MTQRRTPIAAANWKMNLLRRDAADYCRALSVGLDPEVPVEVVLFPPFTLLDTVDRGLGHSRVAWGGQDMHPEPKGAHTGDISGPQLTDVGCRWVLCGHSERRQDHGEDDALVGRKARAAVDHGLTPMICLGETREQRAEGRTLDVLRRQLEVALGAGLERFEIAYEPVWAIGTGETATPEMAQEVHAALRQELSGKVGSERAAAVRILYGGSAKPSNAHDLIVQPDIDGFLVGGAGLDSQKFLAMISACASA